MLALLILSALAGALATAAYLAVLAAIGGVWWPLALFIGWVALSFIFGPFFGRFIRAGDRIQDAADRGEEMGIGGGADCHAAANTSILEPRS